MSKEGDGLVDVSTLSLPQLDQLQKQLEEVSAVAEQSLQRRNFYL